MALANVRTKLATLNRTLARIGSVDRIEPMHLDQLIDSARWTRTYVDLELAFMRQVGELRDERWRQRRFTDAASAWRIFLEFHHATPSLLDASATEPMATDTLGRDRATPSIELSNLRARLEGLIHVAHGWRRSLRAARDASAMSEASPG